MKKENPEAKKPGQGHTPCSDSWTSMCSSQLLGTPTPLPRSSLVSPVALLGAEIHSQKPSWPSHTTCSCSTSRLLLPRQRAPNTQRTRSTLGLAEASLISLGL